MRIPIIRRWFRPALALSLAYLLSYLYLPTFIWLGRQWLGGSPFSGEARDWSHGPLVLMLIGYLLWQRRAEFSTTRPAFGGMALLLAGVGLNSTGVLLKAPYLSACSLIPTSLGVIYLFLGSKTAHQLLVPCLLFLLAVPFPATEWGVTGFLVQVVAAVSALLAGWMGAPVYRSGTLITVGEAEYLVEPLCSGFNLIMALLALAIPLLYLRRVSPKMLVAALLWVPAVGLSAKIALVSTVLILTPVLGQDNALLLYHRWLGIPFYLAGLGLAVLLIAFMPPKSPPAARFSRS